MYNILTYISHAANVQSHQYCKDDDQEDVRNRKRAPVLFSAPEIRIAIALCTVIINAVMKQSSNKVIGGPTLAAVHAEALDVVFFVALHAVLLSTD